MLPTPATLGAATASHETGGLRPPLAWLAWGTFFSTVEEFLTVVVLRRDVGAYVFTLLILFPLFLTLVWFSSRWINRLVDSGPAQELTHYFVYGFAGLMIEWFLIGLSPWSNPSAPALLMLVFQIGMFSFWATVGFAPRLFLNPRVEAQATRRKILWFYIPYFIAVYLLAFTVIESARFLTVIGLIILGYLTVSVYFARYFIRSFARTVVPVPNLGSAG